MLTSQDVSLFTIQPSDVFHALRKWDGRDVVTERYWQATDREFLEGFCVGEISDHLLRRFAATNNNEVATKRTGGYSIVRKFCGGLASWTPRLRRYYETRVLPARRHYTHTRRAEAIWKLTTQLAEMKGQSKKGFTKPLGIVAASKMLFFTCPEMPIFIYDSVVGAALSTDTLPIKEYPAWWHACNQVLESNSSVISLLPKNRQSEFLGKEEWITRRSLDLMLYRLGSAKQRGSGNQLC